MKNEIINIKPAKTSDNAIKLAKKGLKPKYSINFWGGSGNLLLPWIIKAVPKIILIDKTDKNRNFIK